MSYTEYEQFLKDCGTPRTDAEGGEVTLKKSDAIKALDLLSDTDIAVLGGDVYELESDGYFRPTYDNWYCNKDTDEQATFAEKSRKLAYEYLSKYKEKTGSDIRYVLVIDA
ncbi:Imm40 family immunity protein [Marinobacter nauticus]|uniref:Imm40 family immunity protein n=1 Tax=Marinobacter nauticus TaxID=2743 RepID=UPI00242E9D12|nr:Imm40 family immunity protein [Marinobacter nauticus]